MPNRAYNNSLANLQEIIQQKFAYISRKAGKKVNALENLWKRVRQVMYRTSRLIQSRAYLTPSYLLFQKIFLFYNNSEIKII